MLRSLSISAPQPWEFLGGCLGYVLGLGVSPANWIMTESLKPYINLQLLAQSQSTEALKSAVQVVSLRMQAASVQELWLLIGLMLVAMAVNIGFLFLCWNVGRLLVRQAMKTLQPV